MHAAQLHVRDRDGLDLTPALRDAEAAVKEKLGYTIALIEKPLFDPDGVAPDGAHAVADCTAQEWHAAGSSLSLALDPAGRVCAIRAGGGYGLHLQSAGEMMRTASRLAAQLQRDATAAIERALHEVKDRRWPLGDGTALGLLA